MIKPIEGCSGHYYVSDDGLVYSAKSGQLVALKTTTTCYGYGQVRLSIDGIAKTVRVHRLVAEAFQPRESLDRDQVNHLNGDKLDNRASNLEWVTARQNMKHAIDNGLKRHSGENNPSAKLGYFDFQLIVDAVKRGCQLQNVAYNLAVNRNAVARMLQARLGKDWRSKLSPEA